MVIIFEPIGVRYGGMEALNVKLYMPNTTELLIYVAHLSGLRIVLTGKNPLFWEKKWEKKNGSWVNSS